MVPLLWAAAAAVKELGVRLLGVPRHVILAAEALGAVRAAELPVTRVHNTEQNNNFVKEKK